MAILKYRDSEGHLKGINSYKITPVIIAQGKGNSETEVMSQKAVSDEVQGLETAIASKANASDVYSKTEVDSKVSAANTAINARLPIESFNEWSASVPTQEQVNAKANASEVYSKTEVDTKVDQLNEAIEELESVSVWDAGEY